MAQLDGDDPQTVLVGIPGKAAVCDHPQVSEERADSDIFAYNSKCLYNLYL